MDSTESEVFHARLKGIFSGILQWQQLDELWARVKPGLWFFYQVGEDVPEKSLGGDALAARIDALDRLLRDDHDYHYCGIVYVDNVDAPTLIKVYDPNSLGSSCSHNATPTPPRWILSKMQPACITSDVPTPGDRKRWWQLFSH